MAVRWVGRSRGRRFLAHFMRREERQMEWKSVEPKPELGACIGFCCCLINQHIKGHTFVISHFLWVRPLGTTQLGSLLGAALATYGHSQGQTMISSEAWSPLLSSFRPLPEFISLQLKNWGPSFLAAKVTLISWGHSEVLVPWPAAPCGSLLSRGQEGNLSDTSPLLKLSVIGRPCHRSDLSSY